MNEDKRRPDQVKMVRDAFRTARGDAEPDLSRVAESFPGLVEEAARIRAARENPDSILSLGMMARRAIPRLAVVAAMLVLMAGIFGYRDLSTTEATADEIDTLILTGEVGDSVSDILLEAYSGEGNDDG